MDGQHIQWVQLGLTPPTWTSLLVTRFHIRLGFSVQLFRDWEDDKGFFSVPGNWYGGYGRTR
jgi:hypothetical protein